MGTIHAELLELARDVAAIIDTTDGEHQAFVDSGADSIAMLWDINERLRATIAKADAERDAFNSIAESQKHTPNGFDPRWVDAINGALADRDVESRVFDLDDELWERFIGPMLDAIEDNGHCAECARSFGPHYRGPCEH